MCGDAPLHDCDTGTSFSCTLFSLVATISIARNPHAPPVPYMAVGALPQLSAGDCAKYMKFYADLLDVELDLISSAACANSCKVCTDVLYCCTGQP